MKKQKLRKLREEVPLDAEGIDRLSSLLAEALDSVSADRRDVLRLRLALEDILLLWKDCLSEGTRCAFQCGSRMGRIFVEISAPGARVNPKEAQEEGGLIYPGLLAQAGLSLAYSYRDGRNCLSAYPKKQQKMSPLLQLVLAILAAAACGLLCLQLPKGIQAGVDAVVSPLFNALMGILQTLAGPMIFLSICWGILGIGDMQVLGKIGKTVILRFIGAVFLLTGITALCLIWFFRPQGGVEALGGNAAAQIYAMILEIIPQNIISPFLEGNSLQVIFMAVCVGLVLLALGQKVSSVAVFVEQINAVIQYMMEVVSRFIPVFVSLLSMMLSGALNGLGGVVKGLSLGVAACLAWPLLYALAAALRLKVSYPMLVKKLLPTYLIGLATASSAAALSVNLETCGKKLGISESITSFAVPLGQVVFKPGAAVGFLVMAMGLAEHYGLAMQPAWAVTGVLVTGMLAMAAPPIPGGSLTCYTVLLAQLGIPGEAIALAIAGNVILDFFMTSCGISCLQSELVLSANKLGMLDREILRKSV